MTADVWVHVDQECFSYLSTFGAHGSVVAVVVEVLFGRDVAR